jgi:hypothetical protein
MGHEHKKLSNDSIVRGHETSDANPRTVLVSGLSVSVGLLAIGMLISWGAYVGFKSIATVKDGKPRTFTTLNESIFPQPRLQPDPHVALVPFIKNQEEILASYGWVDKEKGVARIPIERAMELVVKQGLPLEPQAAGNK